MICPDTHWHHRTHFSWFLKLSTPNNDDVVHTTKHISIRFNDNSPAALSFTLNTILCACLCECVSVGPVYALSHFWAIGCSSDENSKEFCVVLLRIFSEMNKSIILYRYNYFTADKMEQKIDFRFSFSCN